MQRCCDGARRLRGLRRMALNPLLDAKLQACLAPRGRPLARRVRLPRRLLAEEWQEETATKALSHITLSLASTSMSCSPRCGSWHSSCMAFHTDKGAPPHYVHGLAAPPRTCGQRSCKRRVVAAGRPGGWWLHGWILPRSMVGSWEHNLHEWIRPDDGG